MADQTEINEIEQAEVSADANGVNDVDEVNGVNDEFGEGNGTEEDKNNKDSEELKEAAAKQILNEFAEANPDDFQSKAWLSIKGLLDELEETKASLKRYSPPTTAELDEYIENNPKKTPSLDTARETLKSLREQIKDIQTIARDDASKEMRPDALPPEDVAKIKAGFIESRKTVAERLKTVKSFYDFMGDPTNKMQPAFSALTLPHFATIASTPSSEIPSETAIIRRWAADNGFKVGEKGRIPADVLKKYRERNK